MKLPSPRGQVTEYLIDALARPPHDLPGSLGDHLTPGQSGGGLDVLRDEDLQLALFICYELHYRGWDGVDERWEWQPSILRLRAAAEECFESGLRELVAVRFGDLVAAVEPAAVPQALRAIVAADDGPSLARYVQRHASLTQLREFIAHRSVYHLREADPHSWGLPRLSGAAKAALVEIQIDEYGGGQLDRMHAELFRVTMGELGLDPTYGGYVEAAPALTLATNNLMSLLGLHRRLRGGLLGHLAAFEMTSSLPNRWYGNGLRRLGFGPVATRFFDEHVEADAVHEQIAAHDMCGSFATAEPEGVGELLFGAAACLAVDAAWAVELMDRWAARESSLRVPLS